METSNCTALIPLTPTVDCQAIKLIRQIDRSILNFERKITLDAIRATVKGISINSAYNILKILGYGKAQLCLGRNKWQVRDLLKEKYFPDLTGRRADETPVFWFWGGPPYGLKWYKGTLQTLLDDRILCSINSVGLDATAKILV